MEKPLQIQKASNRLPNLELIGKVFSEVTDHAQPTSFRSVQRNHEGKYITGPAAAPPGDIGVSESRFR